MSNYATKADLDNRTGTDTSKLAWNSDLVCLQNEVDIDKKSLFLLI